MPQKLLEMYSIAIAESADELKEQMNKQFKARERERLQALYLLKSGKCQQIIEIADELIL
jgi:hypothetical protein